MPEIPHSVTVQLTRDLRLRPLAMDDLGQVHIWSSDPASFTHAPHARHTSIEQTREVVTRWDGAWRKGGPSYWIAERRTDGVPVGYGGIHRIRKGPNLAYRLGTEHHGQGYGAQLACAATAFAAEWCPGEQIRAMIRPVNVASRRTAERAGLWLSDERPYEADLPEGAEPSQILLAPRLVTTEEHLWPGSPDYEQVLDLWQRVNEAGGAVGFEGGAPREDVAKALDAHLDRCRAGQGVVGRLLQPRTGELLGAAFWQRDDGAKVAHVAELRRVMVDPRHRHRNLGRLLVAGMHAQARAGGVEISRLTYRGGTGVAPFYASCGYVEVGRVPGGLRLSTGDVDDVLMARRLDGRPLEEA